MSSLQGFTAIVLAALCVIFTLLVIGDLRYIKHQPMQIRYTIDCVVVIIITSVGAYYFW